MRLHLTAHTFERYDVELERSSFARANSLIEFAESIPVLGRYKVIDILARGGLAGGRADRCQRL